jgi:hypothetical protein
LRGSAIITQPSFGGSIGEVSFSQCPSNLQFTNLNKPTPGWHIHSWAKMKTLSPSAKFLTGGSVGGAFSFVLLFFGLMAGGGGHGSYTLWYVGLIVAGVSGFALLAGSVRSGAKKEERGSFGLGLAAIALFAVVGLKFFSIAEWLGSIFF